MEEDGARRRGHPGLAPDGGGPDLISDLPADLLLQVLRRLGCARAAARTSLLSRHWRDLWRRIGDFTFRDVGLRSLLPALDSLVLADVFFLDIRVPEVVPELSPRREEHAVRVSSLLRAAADLSPVELHFQVRRTAQCPATTVHLPRFLRVTSINLHGMNILFTKLPGGQYMFPSLETLLLFACRADVHALVLQCPRLRVLRVTGCLYGDKDITVRSATLRELILESNVGWTGRIDMEVPALNRLVLKEGVEHKLSVSVLAPVVEKVWWQCHYSRRLVAGIGLWGLAGVGLKTESNALALSIFGSQSSIFPHTELNLVQEIKKHLVVSDFSVLSLQVLTKGHAFGAFLFCLLRNHWIRTATISLKIHLKNSQKETCPINCPCDEPNNWRSQTISLIYLEEVEITGFEAEDYELDILRMIFKSAPMLKKMTVMLSDKVNTSSDWCKEISDIFKAHPLVACSVNPSSERTDDSQTVVAT